MTDEGPFIWECSRKGYHDGVCLGVCQIRKFEPTFGLLDGLGWYIVKYNNEARVFLNGFTDQDARKLSQEFGINVWDDNFGRHAGEPFYKGRAWDSLKAWVKAHPKMAKRHAEARHHAYLPDWYDRATTGNSE